MLARRRGAPARDRRVACLAGRLKAARGETGASVDDLSPSAAAGAMRRYLERRAEQMPEHLVAPVPMSARGPQEELELGDRIAGAIVRRLSFNFVVSTVPAPQVPFHLLGRCLETIYAFLPLPPRTMRTVAHDRAMRRSTATLSACSVTCCHV
jgi:WS/DGAT C-terminal domain